MKLVTTAAMAAALAAFGAAAGAAAATPAPPPLRSDSAEEAPDAAPAEGAAMDAAAGPAPEAPDAAAQAEAARQALIAEAQAAAQAARPPEGAPVDPLVEKAATYALFQRDLAAIRDRELAEPVDLDAIMDTLASYDSHTLSDAFLSYGAFLAAQQPDFVDTVQEAAEYYGAAEFLQGMINDPSYAFTFPGAEEAAESVLDVLVTDIEALEDAAGQFKQESYDLQSRGWRNLIARDREERLEKIRNSPRLRQPTDALIDGVSYGAPIASSQPAETARLRRTAFWEAIGYRPAPEGPPASPVTEDEYGRALGVVMTLGAMRALDLSAQRPDLVSQLLGVREAPPACLDFSLLHMQQCVAAAHFKYEDAFCIAEHQLADSARCLAEAVLEPAPEAPPEPEPSLAPQIEAEAESGPATITTAAAADAQTSAE